MRSSQRTLNREFHRNPWPWPLFDTFNASFIRLFLWPERNWNGNNREREKRKWVRSAIYRTIGSICMDSCLHICYASDLCHRPTLCTLERRPHSVDCSCRHVQLLRKHYKFKDDPDTISSDWLTDWVNSSQHWRKHCSLHFFFSLFLSSW